MAVAALVALVHDIVITIGVYSLLQFEVTPSTMIGILTILGYSLYDTVVVFDKVKENTRGILGQSRQTYSQAANLAVNQTLVRSINTSIVALLPVGADPLRGGRAARGRHAQGPVAGAVRGHGGRHLLLDLHRHAVPGPARWSATRRCRPSPAGCRPAARVRAARDRGPRRRRAGGARRRRRPDGRGCGSRRTAARTSTEAMDRARARRTASGPRNQPKKQSRADRH